MPGCCPRAVAKEISRNLNGLSRFGELAGLCIRRFWRRAAIRASANTRYVNDTQITDHYAIIPTGQGLGAFAGLNAQAQRVYLMIVRRFLSIFYPPAVYQKVSLTTAIDGEKFFSGFKMPLSEGYLKVLGRRPAQEKPSEEKNAGERWFRGQRLRRKKKISRGITVLQEALKKLKKGDKIPVDGLDIREGETSPPKRYNSGSMILAMENAGQLIEDEELRAQIKGSGIGTSATRAEILKKLVNIKYLSLNKKTQVLTPTLLGEMVL